MEREIRVLALITELEAGGVQSVVLNYAKQLNNYGIFFDYVVQGPGDKTIEDSCLLEGSRVFHLPEMVHHPFKYRTALIELLRKHPEYHIVHAHQNFLNAWSLWAAKRGGSRVRISHSHNQYNTNSVTTKLFRVVSRIVLNLVATDFWACSENAYLWLYGNAVKNKYILHNSIDVDKFRYQQNVREQIREQVRENDSFICICVGTLSKRKNQNFLLDVLAKIDDTNIKLWLVGSGSELVVLKRKAEELRIENRVCFWGNRTDVNKLLQASDCFCLPSYAEGLPVSVVEAETNGLPCILSSDITREVGLLNTVYFESVSCIDDWVKRISEISQSNMQTRKQSWKMIKEAGFDLETESKKLAEKYRGMHNR